MLFETDFRYIYTHPIYTKRRQASTTTQISICYVSIINFRTKQLYALCALTRYFIEFAVCSHHRRRCIIILCACWINECHAIVPAIWSAFYAHMFWYWCLLLTTHTASAYGRERAWVCLIKLGWLGRICGLRFINIVLRRAAINVFSVRRYIMSAMLVRRWTFILSMYVLLYNIYRVAHVDTNNNNVSLDNTAKLKERALYAPNVYLVSTVQHCQ